MPNKRKRTVKALAKQIIADLRPKYDLVYVDQGDKFTDEQVAAIVKGDYESLWDSTSEWEGDNRYQGAKSVIDEAVEDVIRQWEREDDADYGDVKDAFDGSEWEDRVRSEINDRESGDWVKDLARGSGAVLLRIPIDAIDEDHCYSYEQVEATDVLQRLGFEATEHNIKSVQYALDNASPEFSTLLGYWIVGADVGDMLDLPREGDTRVEITDPYLYLGNPFAGSGFITDDALHGKAYVKRCDLRTDKDAFGYSVDEVYGGLSGSQFSCEIRALADDEHPTTELEK